MNHAEECRKRVAEELEKVGDERLEREKESLIQHLEEEENEKRKAKNGESEQKEKPAASSSGEAGTEAQRSRG